MQRFCQRGGPAVSEKFDDSLGRKKTYDTVHLVRDTRRNLSKNFRGEGEPVGRHEIFGLNSTKYDDLKREEIRVSDQFN